MRYENKQLLTAEFLSNICIITILSHVPKIYIVLLLWSAPWNRADHYIFILWFLLLSFFPHLISAVTDWMSAILPHMVWPLYKFKMQV